MQLLAFRMVGAPRLRVGKVRERSRNSEDVNTVLVNHRLAALQLGSSKPALLWLWKNTLWLYRRKGIDCYTNAYSPKTRPACTDFVGDLVIGRWMSKLNVKMSHAHTSMHSF